MLQSVQRLVDRVVKYRGESASIDLDHEVGAKALLAHPVKQRIIGCDGATQSDLNEIRSGNVFVVDQPANWRAMGREMTGQVIGTVGVGIEVDDAHLPGSVYVGDGRGVWPNALVCAARHT